MNNNFNEKYSYPKNSNGSIIWGVIWPLLIYLGITFLASILVTIILLVIHPESINQLNTFLNKYALVMLISAQIIQIPVFLLVYFNQKKYFPKITNKPNFKVFIFSILGIVSVGIISGFFIAFLAKIINPVDGGISIVNEYINSGSLFLTIQAAVIFAPIIEELLFRGIIFNRINSKWNIWVAILISALIFGFIHFNLLQGLNAFIIGLALAYVYAKTRSLWICIFTHSFNNLLSIICQKINFAINGNYTLDSNISIAIQLTIVVITIILLSSNYFSKDNN